MDCYSLDNDWKGRGQKYNDFDTSLRELSDPNKRLENREFNKEWIGTVSSEDVKPEFIDRQTKVVSYNVAINGEKCVSSKYSILSKDIKQTKYKKIVLAMIFFSCLIVLAVVGAVIFGNSTHNRQNLVEHFQVNETPFGLNFSSMEIPTSTIDSSIKHKTDSIDLTVTSRNSKTSERISSSLSVLFTTLGISKPSTSNTPDTSLPNFSSSVTTNTNASTIDLSPSSGPSMTTSQSKSPFKRVSTTLSVPSHTSSIIQPSLTTSKSESSYKRISASVSEPQIISSITQPQVTAGKSKSPSERISSTSAVYSTTSTIIHPSVATSQSNHPSERISTTSSVPSSTTTITFPSMTNSKSKHPSEKISSTSSPTSSTITEQNQLTRNIATIIGKQTTTLKNTSFVSTTSSSKTSSTIPTTKEQLLTSTKTTNYPKTQSHQILTQTTPVSKTQFSVLNPIKVPPTDEHKITELMSKKTSSQITTSVTTFVKPFTHPSENTSSTSSPTSSTITEQNQLTRNIATIIGKQTTALKDTSFVSTTSSSKTSSTIPTTKEPIKVPPTDEHRIPELMSKKTSSQITSSVTTFVKPFTEEQKTPSLLVTQ